MTIIVREISAEQTRPLRQQILRPHYTLEQLQYDGDEDTLAFHVGAFDEEKLIGVSSIFPGIPPIIYESLEIAQSKGDVNVYRIRGVAVLPEYQGQGIGQLMIKAGLDYVDRKAKTNGSSVIWCNARVKAKRFYERLGFEAKGLEFEIPKTGPHYYMERVKSL